MTRCQSFIGSALFVGFFVIWFLWEFVSFDPFVRLLGNEKIAAWIQAFGSLIALAVAIWVSGSHIRMERKKAAYKARIVIRLHVIAFSGISVGIQQSSTKIVRRAFDSFESVIKLADEVDFALLSDSAIAAFVILRQDINIVNAMVNEFDINSVINEKDEILRVVKYYLDRVHEECTPIFGRHAGISAEKFDTYEFFEFLKKRSDHYSARVKELKSWKPDI